MILTVYTCAGEKKYWEGIGVFVVESIRILLPDNICILLDILRYTVLSLLLLIVETWL